MLEILETLSGSSPAATLDWTLRDWERRRQDVALYQGTVLTLTEDRRYLAEALAPHIERTLAPGVYLLTLRNKAQALELLQKAGVDIIALPHLTEKGPLSATSPWVGSPPIQESEGADLFRTLGSPDLPPKKNEIDRALPYLERFRKSLDNLSLSPFQRNELERKIRERLILSEGQLQDARFEKTEARNLDYVGKTTIVKQALAAKTPVEVTYPGENLRIRGIPAALEKKEGEAVLVLTPLPGEVIPTFENGPQDAPLQGIGGTIRLPLGKISLIRRIKQSIFE
jgi:hypothetical protein